MSLAVISPGPVTTSGRLDLGGVRVHPADDALEVQDDVGDVFLDAADRRELVCDALDPDAGHGRARERGEQHAPQRVAEGVAEAPIERLDRERASVLVDTLVGDSWDLEVEHQGPNVVGFLPPPRRPSASRAALSEDARPKLGLLRVQLDDQLLLHRRGDLPPLGLAEHLRRERVVIGLKPRRHLAGELRRIADHLLRARAACGWRSRRCRAAGSSGCSPGDR